ncbi:MAG TPA: SRPBCC domain-containing protein [Trebonia sp.]|nr:SRPBCC domain-containing protein [Trebonia sp.]
MTDLAVIHDTFAIERTYPASPSRVFAAFATRAAKDAWNGDEPADPAVPATPAAQNPDEEFDFRVGGHERFAMTYQGIGYRYDACYYDIVQDQRLVYSYEMYADGARISVSVATIEFAATAGGTGTGTTLTWTEQGAYLDGFDGAEASSLRQGGTEEMLDGLAKYLS